MNDYPTIALFPCGSNVQYKSTYVGVFTVKEFRKCNGGCVYLVENVTGNLRLATHEELMPYYGIEVGDAVIVGTQRHIVISISADKLFAELQNVTGVLSMSKMTLVPRVTVEELLNAMRIVYGSCNHALETRDGMKMGDVETMYGRIISSQIILGRKSKLKR